MVVVMMLNHGCDADKPSMWAKKMIRRMTMTMTTSVLLPTRKCQTQLTMTWSRGTTVKHDAEEDYDQRQ